MSLTFALVLLGFVFVNDNLIGFVAVQNFRLDFGLFEVVADKHLTVVRKHNYVQSYLVAFVGVEFFNLNNLVLFNFELFTAGCDNSVKYLLSPVSLSGWRKRTLYPFYAARNVI